MRATVTVDISKGNYEIGSLGAASSDHGGAHAADDRILRPDVNGVRFRPATFDGPILVTIETPDEPTDFLRPPEGEWEVVNEDTLVARDRELRLIEGYWYTVEGLPLFELVPGDVYRVRLSVQGYAEGLEEHAVDFPVEHHFLQIWRTGSGVGLSAEPPTP